MTPDDLAAIRERDAIAVTFDDVGEHTNVQAEIGDLDRRTLLRAYDALRAAAAKVTCKKCELNDAAVEENEQLRTRLAEAESLLRRLMGLSCSRQAQE